MPILGAHMSIAGGYYKAVEAARGCTCQCVQLFTKNSNQWRAKPITDADVERFQTALRRLRIGHPISHSAYLINLATPERGLWAKSIETLVVELQRAEQLGIPYVGVHPGAYTTSNPSAGLRRIVRALDEVHCRMPRGRSRCLLETTAGQGSTLGWRFEHLATVLDQVKHPDRLGVCFDTCHVFAAGYPLAPKREYRATMDQFDQIVGLGQIKAFHLNDSQGQCGSRLDRHQHIGDGAMGHEPFRLLLTDRRFRHIPMYLETPKGQVDGQSWDVKNLKVLRSLGSAATRPARP